MPADVGGPAAVLRIGTTGSGDVEVRLGRAGSMLVVAVYSLGGIPLPLDVELEITHTELRDFIALAKAVLGPAIDGPADG